MKNNTAFNEVVRFIINGLIATSVHFVILYLCVSYSILPYDGISNLIGAIFGSIFSFLGNKFYVFRGSNNNVFIQTSQFIVLYALMALNHGVFLYYWSDLGNHNYMVGFIIVTIVNTIISFLCNKYMIFNQMKQKSTNFMVSKQMKKKSINFIILSIMYLSIFLIVYLVHINFFKVDVILYSAIFDFLLSLAIFAVIFYLTKFSDYYNNFEISQILIIFLLIGYSISISLPTVVDRSLSFYILEKISAHNGSIKTSVMRDIFVNDYINEYKLVEVRITEQVASGTIELKDGCINLTDKGKLIVGFSSYFRKNFLAKERLLLNEYTDVLTDPLKDSELNESYVCQSTI